jgi:hypothetical protein
MASNRVLLLIVLCSVLTAQAHAQSISAFGGVNYGGFYSVRKAEGHFMKEFDRSFGYLAGIEMSDLKIDSIWNFTIGLGLEQYGGSFYLRDGGLGGSNHVLGELRKEVLFLCLSPVNFRLFKYAFIRPGLNLNYELHKKVSGENYSWNMSIPQPLINDLSVSKNFTQDLNGGILIQIGYSIEIKKISIEPRYSFFIGVSREMNNSQAIVNSFRHEFAIGVSLQ